jgi:hypothetical protein
VGSKLFQAKSDTFLVIIEIEDDNIQFLVELYDLLGMVNPSPRQIGYMNKSVDSAKVDKYTVRCNIFNGSFENLSFFKFSNDLFLLLFKLCFDKSFV